MDTTEAKTKVDELSQSVRSMQSQKQDLEKQLKRVDTKLHYTPKDEDAKTERGAIVDSLTDTAEQLETLQQQLNEAQTALTQAQITQERERLASEATGYEHEFSLPGDDPIIECQMWSAVADKLQYLFCSTQGYYEALCGRVYGNQAGTDQAIGYGTTDDPNPEIASSDINELERIQTQRDYIQKLRFAVEAKYNKAEAEIPADSTFRPTLLRRSDQEVLRQIEQRREERFARQQEERRAAQEESAGFSRRVDLSVYQPGAAA